MFKIGHGYDVHRLVHGRELILGGEKIPFEKGLDGHSDADVLTHAIIDAILGALGEGDIGTLFPDTDDTYKDICSLSLLKKVADILDEKNYTIANIDTTVIAQKPKLQPYIAKIKIKIAIALDIKPNIVNVKATTEEGLGFTGNGEGIASHAVVLIKLKS